MPDVLVPEHEEILHLKGMSNKVFSFAISTDCNRLIHWIVVIVGCDRTSDNKRHVDVIGPSYFCMVNMSPCEQGYFILMLCNQSTKFLLIRLIPELLEALKEVNVAREDVHVDNKLPISFQLLPEPRHQLFALVSAASVFFAII